MVGILLSYWGSLFSGATLDSGRVAHIDLYLDFLTLHCAGISKNSSAAAQSMLPSDSLGNHSKSLLWNRPALWMSNANIFHVCDAIAMPMNHSPSTATLKPEILSRFKKYQRNSASLGGFVNVHGVVLNHFSIWKAHRWSTSALGQQQLAHQPWPCQAPSRKPGVSPTLQVFPHSRNKHQQQAWQ